MDAGSLGSVGRNPSQLTKGKKFYDSCLGCKRSRVRFSHHPFFFFGSFWGCSALFFAAKKIPPAFRASKITPRYSGKSGMTILGQNCILFSSSFLPGTRKGERLSENDRRPFMIFFLSSSKCLSQARAEPARCPSG